MKHVFKKHGRAMTVKVPDRCGYITEISVGPAFLKGACADFVVRPNPYSITGEPFDEGTEVIALSILDRIDKLYRSDDVEDRLNFQILAEKKCHSLEDLSVLLTRMENHEWKRVRIWEEFGWTVFRLKHPDADAREIINDLGDSMDWRKYGKENRNNIRLFREVIDCTRRGTIFYRLQQRQGD